MEKSIPVCFHNTQKVVLDDDQAFTDSILIKMHGKNFNPFNSPSETLNYLLNNYHPSFTKYDLIDKNLLIEKTTQHSMSINIDIETLKGIVKNSYLPDISVLLVDYHMPEMNGIDFLKEIQHLPIKKVLITGEIDYKIGIDAFNAKLVDAYIRKDDPDFINKIVTIVAELEWKYFVELSSLIIDVPDLYYLNSPHLTSTFQQILFKHHITKFYLNDIQGDFVTQNIHNAEKYILIRNKSQLKALAKVAEEDGGSSELIRNLKQGKVIPFFDSKEYWEIPANEWDNYIYPACTIINDTNLVWVLVEKTLPSN